MRLADFIEDAMTEILAEWDAFAATKLPAALKMDGLELRDHSSQILNAIAADLREHQTETDRIIKSHGLSASVTGVSRTAAEVHGALRAQHGFSMTQLISEFRALRASVLRLWVGAEGALSNASGFDDMMRFNEAIDQAIAESVDLFSQEHAQERIHHEKINRELKLSQGRLEYASRLSSVGFWYCDLPFDVLEWDDQVKEHFFLDPCAQVTIDTFYERILPEDRELTRSAIDTSIRSGDAYDIVYRTAHPDTGHIKWIRALGGTDYASDGSPIHFDGITVDVTAQKLMEKHIADSAEQHRGVLANMDEAFVLFDPRFDIIEVNDATCRLVRMTRGQLVGANHWQLFPGTYESNLGQMYHQVLQDGRLKVLEYAYELEGGQPTWYEVRAFKVGTNVAALFRDVTEKHNMIETLKDTDKRKDEFLAMLAHELRNPLSPIITAGEILARVAPNGPGEAAISVIRRQAKQMTRLLDDLLDIARVTQGRIHLQKVAVDITDVIEQACESCEPQRQAKHQRLTLRSENTSPLYVEGDFARLVQCVGNILTNAIKYTDNNGEIEVRVRDDENTVVIEVSDSGSGISPELLPQIFDLFVQSHRTLDRSQGGLGVGLAVVKRLIHMHGGGVKAFSQGEGLGSKFELQLPRIAIQAAKADEAVEVSVTSRRILVVDDNVDAAESLATLLEMQGHVLLAVHSAHHALAIVPSFEPDVMLIDIGLPDIDGYGLVQELNKLSLRKPVKKVALTGYGQAEDKKRALETGFDLHMVKPVDLDTLGRAISASS